MTTNKSKRAKSRIPEDYLLIFFTSLFSWDFFHIWHTFCCFLVEIKTVIVILNLQRVIGLIETLTKSNLWRFNILCHLNTFWVNDRTLKGLSVSICFMQDYKEATYKTHASPPPRYNRTNTLPCPAFPFHQYHGKEQRWWQREEPDPCCQSWDSPNLGTALATDANPVLRPIPPKC